MEGIEFSQVAALIVFLLGIITFISSFLVKAQRAKKEIKDDALADQKIDQDQDIKIVKLEARIRAVENDVAEIKGSYKSLDGKLSRQIEKLEGKIDKLSITLIEFLTK